MNTRFHQKIWGKIEKLDRKEKVALAAGQNFHRKLFKSLMIQRGRGRNDYPIPKMWNCLVSKLIIGQAPKEATTCSISRFLSSLLPFQPLMGEILENQIRKYREIDPEFGSVITLYQWKKSFFLLDASTALPILSGEKGENSIASVWTLLEKLEQLLPGELYKERCLIADSNFDDENFIAELWDRYQIKPIVPLNREKIVSPVALDKECLYNEDGEVQCERRQPMVYSGFEKKRNALKFRCIFFHYGLSCEHEADCKVKSGVRVPLELNRRLITPIPRCSCKWKALFQLSENVLFFEKHLRAFFKQNCRYTGDKEKLINLIGRSILYSHAIGVVEKQTQAKARVF